MNYCDIFFKIAGTNTHTHETDKNVGTRFHIKIYKWHCILYLLVCWSLSFFVDGKANRLEGG